MNSNKSIILDTPMHACEREKEWAIGGMWQGLEWQAGSIDYHWRSKLGHSVQMFISNKNVVKARNLGVISSFSLHERRCWTCGDHDGFSLHL
jgi:hypothetical protein